MMRLIVTGFIGGAIFVVWALNSGFNIQKTIAGGAGSEVPALPNNPKELGQVHWLRDFDQAIEKSEKEDKAVLILFQEVPGCGTCTRYGSQVLSHPLIVEAIESLFVPVAIYNNEGGKDAKVLAAFNEPSWNNPVVRIVDHESNPLAPRLSSNYSPLGMVQTIKSALASQNREIPEYLNLLEEELLAEEKGIEEAVFSMYCFWTGEKTFGNIPGVVGHQAGFMNGREVVKVQYNPEAVSFDDLAKTAHQSHCADEVYTDDPQQAESAKTVVGDKAVKNTGNFRLDREPKYYLSQTPLRYVPMTAIQASRVNAALGSGGKYDNYLSPRQLTLLKSVRENPKKDWENVVENANFRMAWEMAVKKLSQNS